MRRILFLFALLTAAMLTACGNDVAQKAAADTMRAERKETAAVVPFVEVRDYVVRQGVRTDSVPTIIRSQEVFDRYFEKAQAAKKATVVQPDFDNRIVIAVILDETSIETALEPERLSATSSALALKCRVTLGKAMSDTMQPFLLLMVDKGNDRPDLLATFEVK